MSLFLQTHTHKHTNTHRTEMLLALGNGFHGNGKQCGLTTSHTGLLRSRLSVLKSTEKDTSMHAHTQTHTHLLIMFILACEDPHRHNAAIPLT